MPDLAERRKHEAEMAAALALLLTQEEQRIMANPFSFDRRGFEVRAQAAIQPKLDELHSAAAAKMASDLGLSTDEVAAIAKRTALDHAGALSAVIAERTATALRDAADQAHSVQDATMAMAILFSADRAGSIATTEVTRAVSLGERAAISRIDMNSGLVVTPIWNTEHDGKVCPICKPLDGTTDAVFSRVAPGGPPAHPNCRCFLTYEVR